MRHDLPCVCCLMGFQGLNPPSLLWSKKRGPSQNALGCTSLMNNRKRNHCGIWEYRVLAACCVCVSGSVKTQAHVYEEKRGIEWPACCTDAGSDKTVPCDATISRNAKGRVFLGTSLWPLTALVSTTFTQQWSPLSGATKQIILGWRMYKYAQSEGHNLKNALAHTYW